MREEKNNAISNDKFRGLEDDNNKAKDDLKQKPKTDEYNEQKDYCIGVLIDTNGYTRPNKFGKDQYLLKMYKDIITE